MQTELTVMVRMFERVDLRKNLSKTKAMICTPGFIWGHQVVETHKRRDTGEGPIFRERKRTRVNCEECGGEMAASFLRHNMKRSHGIAMMPVRRVDVGGGGPDIYKVSLFEF